ASPGAQGLRVRRARGRRGPGRRRVDPRAEALIAKHDPFRLDDRVAVAGKRAPDRFAAPLVVAAFDAVEIVAGAMLARRRLRGRRRADNRDGALRSFERDERVRVVVAMDDELGPMA